MNKDIKNKEKEIKSLVGSFAKLAAKSRKQTSTKKNLWEKCVEQRQIERKKIRVVPNVDRIQLGLNKL